MPNDISDKKAWVWLWLSAAIILIDQLSKYFVNTYLPYGQQVHLLPFFNLWLKYNAGASFGFLGTAGGWQVFLFSGISIIVVVAIFAWFGKVRRSNWMLGLSLSLILGGACGNLIDRLRYKYVIDFFDFHVGHWHFATFNVADTAICIGAVFLVIKLLFFHESITR